MHTMEETPRRSRQREAAARRRAAQLGYRLAKSRQGDPDAIDFARFIRSINAAAGAREVFSRFAIEEVEATSTISTATTGGGKRVGEFIMTGGG